MYDKVKRSESFAFEVWATTHKIFTDSDGHTNGLKRKVKKNRERNAQSVVDLRWGGVII